MSKKNEATRFCEKCDRFTPHTNYSCDFCNPPPEPLKVISADDLREKIVKKFGSVTKFATAAGRKVRDVSRTLYMIDYRLTRSKFKKKEELARQDFEELEKLCDELSAQEERTKITEIQRTDLNSAINLSGKSVTDLADSIGVSKSTIYSITSGEQKYVTKQVKAVFEKLFIA